MKEKIKIVLAQLNFTVGDIKGNLHKHIEAANVAKNSLNADLIIFPELSLTGYPPEDLLLRQSFIQDTDEALRIFMNEAKNIHALISYPTKSKFGIYNACAITHDGKILTQYAKQHLPNYGVFDECRYFIPYDNICVVNIHNVPVGIVICEDLWFDGTVEKTVKSGAKLIISPNASPFEVDKHERRVAILKNRATSTNTSIIYVNNVSGQDELIFDGGSMVMNHKGELTHFAGFMSETLLPVEYDITNHVILNEEKIPSIPNHIERTYSALVFSLREYLTKNNQSDVLIGVSGGIDSALTLAIAVDALGSDHVHAVFMPSRYTSKASVEEANTIIKNLNVHADTISIEPIFSTFCDMLSPVFNHLKPDVTEENIQARSRAVILMALSNKLNKLVITTGNRSEYAVGYCTLYGDMAGGFAVLKDVPKTLVYELAQYRNTISPVIPKHTIDRAPTAELAPNQVDQDTLPPYAILDQILKLYLNDGLDPEAIVEKGFAHDIVMNVIRLVRQSEYKRKQSALGPHINHKSFNKDWRYPVTNHYKK